MASSPTSASTAQHQALLGDVLEELQSLLLRGELVSLEESLARWPEHAAAIESLWPAMQAMIQLGFAEDRVDPATSAGGPFPPEESASGSWGVVGDFHIVKEIGRGGMGVVYEAYQLSLKRRVALKVLPFAAVLDPHRLQRFKNEAQAAATLQHPHIVPVYAVGCERGMHYYAMQFIEGQTLQQVIGSLAEIERKRRPGGIQDAPIGPADSLAATLDRTENAASAVNGRGGVQVNSSTAPIAALSTCETGADRCRLAARLGAQIADALDRAHSMGVTHRDIKPSNLILDTSGDPWVTDFGLAMIETDASLTQSGALMGTLRYMSPEQADGSHGVLDHRTDIYSLGATLYELISLRPAFNGVTHPELLKQVIQEEPPPLRQIATYVDQDLETIVHRAMSKEPSARFPTAGEMAAELRRFLAGDVILSRRPTPLQRAARWTRRHTAAVWTALVLMLLATVASIAAALLLEDARSEAELAWRTARRNEQSLAEANKSLRDEAIRVFTVSEERTDLLYDSKMMLADMARWNGDPLAMDELLAEFEPSRQRGEKDRRGFEWRLLKNISRPDRELRAAEQPLYSAAFSSDGQTLAVAGQDAILRVYDAHTLLPRIKITGQIEINQIAFSPDDRLVATTGDDGTVRIWNLATLKQQLLIPAHPGKAFSAVFHPDGESLFTSGDDASIRRWSTREGALLEEITGDEVVNAIALSPDGGWLAAVVNDRRATIWRLSENRQQLDFPLTAKGAEVAFSPDGLWWASGDKGGMVQVYGVGQSFISQHIQHRDGICGLAFSTDGKRLAVSDRGGTAAVHELTGSVAPSNGAPSVAASEQGLARWRAHHGRAYDLAWAPKSGDLCSVGEDGAVRLWRRPAERLIRRLTNHPDTAEDLARAPNEGQFLAVLQSPGQPMRMSLLDVETGELRSHPFPGMPIEHLAVSKDGKMLALAMQEGKGIRFGKATAPQEDWFEAAAPGFDDLDFSPNGRLLAVAPEHNGSPVTLFDSATGERHAVLPNPGSNTAPAFSSDGRWLAVDSGNDIEVWEVAARSLWCSFRGHRSTIKDLEFSPDGQTLASASADRTLRFWDVPGRSEKLSVMAGRRSLMRLAYAPDGMTIATGDEAGQVRLWSATQGGELCTVSNSGRAVWGLCFSAAGRYLAWRDREAVWVADSGPPEVSFSIARLPVDERRPRSAGDPNGFTLGVAVEAQDSLLHIFDADANRWIGRVKLPTSGMASDVVMAPDASRAYVSLGAAKQLVTVNLEAFTVLGKPIDLPTQAQGLAITADGRFVLATGPIGAGDPVSVIDTTTRRVTSFLHGSPNAVAVNASGDILLADASANLLRKAKISPGGAVALSHETLELPGAFQVILAPDGRTGVAAGGAFLCSFTVDGLRKVKSHQVDPVNSIAFSPLGDRFFARNHGLVHCFPFHASNGQWEEDDIWGYGEFPLAISPAGVNRLAVSPDGLKVYIARDGSMTCLQPADSDTMPTVRPTGVSGFLLGVDIRRPKPSSPGQNRDSPRQDRVR